MNRSITPIVLACCCLAHGAWAASTAAPSATRPAKDIEVTIATGNLPSSPGYHTLKAQVRVKQEQFPMSFGVFLPRAYFASKEPFPLVMTLHNRDRMGVDGQKMTDEGMAGLWIRDNVDMTQVGSAPVSDPATWRKAARFIGIAPQCPTGQDFDSGPMPQVLADLAGAVVKAYRVDEDRVYLTGFSYGGTCTWRVAEQVPGRWAAIAPISARPTTRPVETGRILKDVGIYVGWGSTEWARGTSLEMKAGMEQAGHTNVVYREIAGGTHWCYPAIYTDKGFWDWLLAQRRGKAPTARPATRPVGIASTQPADGKTRLP